MTGPGSLRGLKVLLIQQDEPARRVLRDLLGRRGLRVHQVVGGEELRTALEEGLRGTTPLPDVVVTDELTPWGPGLAALDALSSRGWRPAVVVATPSGRVDSRRGWPPPSAPDPHEDLLAGLVGDLRSALLHQAALDMPVDGQDWPCTPVPGG